MMKNTQNMHLKPNWRSERMRERGGCSAAPAAGANLVGIVWSVAHC